MAPNFGPSFGGPARPSALRIPRRYASRVPQAVPAAPWSRLVALHASCGR